MIQLSQSKINSWQTCERQFQLRYVERSEWPTGPYSAESTEALELGEIFHMLVAQRIILGPQFELPTDLYASLKGWWGNFLQLGLLDQLDQLEPKPRVETSLSVQVNEQVKLIGRVDLLIVGANSVEIFDWKTGRPRTKLDLEQDWQTRIYMALLYKLRGVAFSDEIPVEKIAMTYWYLREPNRSVKIQFDEKWHLQNWDELIILANQISDRLHHPQIVWPLTTNSANCGRCAFNVLCDREPGHDLSVAEQTEQGIDELDGLFPADVDTHPDI